MTPPSLETLNKYSQKKYHWNEESYHSAMAPRSNPIRKHWRIESESGEAVTEWYTDTNHWAVIGLVNTLTLFAKIESGEVG